MKIKNREELLAKAAEWTEKSANDIVSRINAVVEEAGDEAHAVLHSLGLSQREIDDIRENPQHLRVNTLAKVLIANGLVVEVKPEHLAPEGALEEEHCDMPARDARGRFVSRKAASAVHHAEEAQCARGERVCGGVIPPLGSPMDHKCVEIDLHSVPSAHLRAIARMEGLDGAPHLDIETASREELIEAIESIQQDKIRHGDIVIPEGVRRVDGGSIDWHGGRLFAEEECDEEEDESDEICDDFDDDVLGGCEAEDDEEGEDKHLVSMLIDELENNSALRSAIKNYLNRR